MERKKFKTVEEYLSTLPKQARALSEQLRKAIKDTAPAAEELISYNMPAFKWHGMLVYYAAYNHHIGLYPAGSPIAAFKEELKNYKTSKGAIQFQIEDGIPVSLVKKIVKYRMKENLEREAVKAAKTKPAAKRKRTAK